MNRILFTLFLLFALLSGARAQETQRATPADDLRLHEPQENEGREDSVRVSLITCSPGSLVYELYGHTALRVKEVREGRRGDWVFNYGTFSFKQPHFAWRFMLGRTDYELSVVPYSYFYEAYMREGRGIEEQQLNLTPEEETKLVDALTVNLDPKNAVYRYNFFYDNCTTRALDRIEKAVDGKVLWAGVDESKSLRDIVREFSVRSPWNRFGQDLLLGMEADRKADRKLQSFAPIYAMQFVGKARIQAGDGSVRPLVEGTTTLLPAQPTLDEPFPVSPMMAFGTLLAIAVFMTLYEWKKRTYVWLFDTLLLIAQGLVGCLISFLFFFSEHPAVGSNLLVTMLNPLPLLYFPWFMKHAAQGRRDRAMWVQGAMLLLTAGFGIVGLQSFPSEFYLIIATLALRCGWYQWIHR